MTSRTALRLLLIASPFFISQTPAAPKTQLAPPESLSGVRISADGVALSWIEATAGETGFSIERSVGTMSAFAPLGTVPRDVTSFIDAEAPEGSTYYYRVRAIGRHGDTSTWSDIMRLSITLVDLGSPTVSLTAPASATTITSAQTLLITASAQDNVGVTRVEFYDGATLAGSDASSPYQYSWAVTSAVNGSHAWTARAYDAAGNAATSPGVVLTVNIAPPTAGGGATMWSKRLGSASVDVSQSVMTDSGDGILMAGYFATSTNLGGTTLTSAGGADIFVAEYTAAGAHVWSRSFGGPGDETPQDVAVDPSGNPIVIGFFTGTGNAGGGSMTSAGSYDIFVAKYSGNGGTHAWSKRFGSTLDDVGYAVAVDYRGDVFVTGFFTGTVDFGGVSLASAYGGADTFVAKLAGGTGATLWAKRFSNNAADTGYGLATDGNGDLYVTGYFMGKADFGGGLFTSAGLEDIYIAKLGNALGDPLWSRRIGGLDQDTGYDVAVDVSDNVVLMGTFRGTADFGGGAMTANGPMDMALAKYSRTGTHLWSRKLGGSATDTPAAMWVDVRGDVLLSGHFTPSTNLGGSNLTSAGGYDAFAAKYAGSSGAHVWSKRLGGTSDDLGSGVASDGNGYVTVSGRFWGSADFGGGTMTAAGFSDVFLLCLAP